MEEKISHTVKSNADIKKTLPDRSLNGSHNGKTYKSERKSIRSRKTIQSPAKLGSKPELYLDREFLAKIRAGSFIVMEYPSKSIVCGNLYRKCSEIASLTKIATFYTVLQLLK